MRECADTAPTKPGRRDSAAARRRHYRNCCLIICLNYIMYVYAPRLGRSSRLLLLLLLQCGTQPNTAHYYLANHSFRAILLCPTKGPFSLCTEPCAVCQCECCYNGHGTRSYPRVPAYNTRLNRLWWTNGIETRKCQKTEQLSDLRIENKRLCYGRWTARQLVSRNSLTTKHPI